MVEGSRGKARFQGFKVSRFQSFKVSRFQSFKVSKFQSFKVSRLRTKAEQGQLPHPAVRGQDEPH
jgi:hypothetical protein